ncbi:MAG: glycosyltransferase family 2 protein [Thermoplasmatota archaeon]
MRVTICIPTLNEEQGIGPTLDSVDRAAFQSLGHEVDFLVVDGASQDRTQVEAEARGAKVLIEPRKGYGRAYKSGFAAAEGDILVTGDADGTYPFDKAHEYVQYLLENDLDFVTCDRYGQLMPGSMSGKHRLGNWVLSQTTRTLFRVRLRDSQSGMWIIRKGALAKLPIERLPDGMAFSQEIKIHALRQRELRAAEIPSELHPRIGDAVIESWRDGLGNLKALFGLRLRGSR